MAAVCVWCLLLCWLPVLHHPVALLDRLHLFLLLSSFFFIRFRYFLLSLLSVLVHLLLLLNVSIMRQTAFVEFIASFFFFIFLFFPFLNLIVSAVAIVFVVVAVIVMPYIAIVVVVAVAVELVFSSSILFVVIFFFIVVVLLTAVALQCLLSLLLLQVILWDKRVHSVLLLERHYVLRVLLDLLCRRNLGQLRHADLAAIFRYFVHKRLKRIMLVYLLQNVDDLILLRLVRNIREFAQRLFKRARNLHVFVFVVIGWSANMPQRVCVDFILIRDKRRRQIARLEQTKINLGGKPWMVLDLDKRAQSVARVLAH
mmetsp:Transcript_52651/g.83866  ORF Transcript_52651/g.83866 Transcript_52651/m.83866 type:complete len:313 (-) Transcript_52651:1915-2853(-)